MGCTKKINENEDILWTRRSYLDEIERIENENNSFPWNREEFIKNLRDSDIISTSYLIGEDVVGYSFFGLYNDRIELLNLGVDKRFWGRGIGGHFIGILKDTLLPLRQRKKIEAIVREGDLPMQVFLRGQEFKAVEILENWYDNNFEDGYLFEFRTDAKRMYLPKNRISEHLNGTPIW
jgi:ribosomal protein S18 acetylase RimI-like enzyme